jgi:RAT1-interacting protein
MHWGDVFLAFLQQHVPNQKKDETGHKVWRVKFTPSSGVLITQLDSTEVDEVSAGEDRIGFIPRWYFDTLDEACG